MSKKILALFLVAVMVFGLAACGGSSGSTQNTSPAASQQQPAVQDTATAAVPAAGRILNVKDDAWSGTDMYQCDDWSNFQSAIADSVLTIDPDTGKLMPGIASAYSFSDDGLTLRLTFPEGMAFPDGTPLGPEDFIASINYGRDGQYADGYANIQSMEVDGRDVVCHLSEFRSDLEYFLGCCFIGIISKTQLDTMTPEQLLWGAVPYGPFYVSDYVPGSYVMLKPNPNYVTHNPLVKNQGPPKLAGIKVNITEMEDFAVVTALEQGDFDFVSTPTSDAVNELRGQDGIQIEYATYPNVELAEINWQNPILSDARVREALFLGVDRDSLQQMAGNDLVPVYSFIYNAMMNYSQDAEDYFKANYGYNPDKAKQLLADAGWTAGSSGYLEKDGQILEFTILSPTSGIPLTVAQDMQIQYKDLGIKMDMETLDWDYRSQRVRASDYDMSLSNWAWYEPILILNNIRDDPNAITDPDAYSAEVNKIAETVDDAARTKLIGDIQIEIFKDLNCLPLYAETQYVAYGPGAAGVIVYPNASMFFNDME